ncbi:hypothetical protein O181_009916 [Austropuccinia psidii MF-1]|uniref:Uncharacterized protein n=1 Tax=Austropuccinia psidii MF-1 TaxID=1389203 RepID=A0A9Q3GJX2_9BASI|nr:hypothetical protein [Austropuccinia psidii MF-1]
MDLPSHSWKSPFFYGPGMALAIQAIWPIWPPGNPLKNERRRTPMNPTYCGPWHAGHRMQKKPKMGKSKFSSQISLVWQGPEEPQMDPNDLKRPFGPISLRIMGTSPLL